MSNNDGIFFLWVAGLSKRSAKRKKRHQDTSNLDAIDSDFLRHRIEEVFLTDVEEFGVSMQFSDAQAERCIIGFMCVALEGQWTGPLTPCDAEQRWIMNDPKITNASTVNNHKYVLMIQYLCSLHESKYCKRFFLLKTTSETLKVVLSNFYQFQIQIINPSTRWISGAISFH